MAGEIRAAAAGDYAFVFQPGTHLVRNVSAAEWQVFPDTDTLRLACAVGLTPLPDGSAATGDLPADLPLGVYACQPYTLIGLSPASGDTALTPVLSGLPESFEALLSRLTESRADLLDNLVNLDTPLSGIPALVWTYAGPRTVTIPAALLAQLAQGTKLGVLRGDTLPQNVTGLGSIAGRTRFWFTVKRKDSDKDTDALIQIVEGVGLVRLVGKAAIAGQGSLTVTDQTAGNVTVHLDAVASAQLPVGTWQYDFQMLTASGVRTLAAGQFVVLADITRATS
jgi:hypothetical protein